MCDIGQVTARFGKYQLLEHLASGGMADIFLARAATMNGAERLLVIKRIHAEKSRDTRFVDLFMREARMAALLEHPNLVQTYDVGRVGGEYFLVMEYLHGLDLQQLVQACQQRGMNKPPLEVSLAVLRAVLAGLHYAHDKRDFDGTPLGIVHRDVTPQNVRVTFEGVVKLLDFGLAAVSSEVPMGGKAPYMSPEQARGAPLDQRSDIFSAGILLYELTVGRRLYRAQGDIEARQRILREPTPDPRRFVADYPEMLRGVVMRALAKDPEARFETAAEMETALAAFCRQMGLEHPLGSFMGRFEDAAP
jgi:serine/threonine protein kinase